MLFRIFIFLLGFGLSVIGFTYIISYLNLLDIGYNFNYYVHFICRRLECLYALIGIVLLIISINMPKGDNDELHL